MTTFTTSDSVTLFYKDWGAGQPVFFSHGWPLSSDAWDNQMMYFGQQGYRVIAHDRRGHGRSQQTWAGNDMDRYADDLAELFDHLDLSNIIMVGHSTGGGEVAHYIGRHGSTRVAKVVLVGAVPPLMLKTDANSNGTSMEVFDGLRAGIASNRSQLYRDLTVPFYGFNRQGVAANEGLQQAFWLRGMQGGIKSHYDCIHEFSEVDYTADLKAINKPVLLIHGDDDQIVPIAASAELAVKLIDDGILKVYPGGSHGLAQLDADKFNADVLAFIRS